MIPIFNRVQIIKQIIGRMSIAVMVTGVYPLPSKNKWVPNEIPSRNPKISQLPFPKYFWLLRAIV